VLRPISYVFGFLNPGSVLKDPHAGNPQRPKSEGTVRIVVDDKRKAIINAQGYPHKGLDYTIANLKKFSEGSRGNAKILLNFSGITDVHTEDAVLDSCKEILVRSAPYVDFGFEENRTSPNTDFNKMLQTPEFTKKIIDLMNTHVPGKVKVSKISPYSKLPPSDEERKAKLKSIKVFYESGGQMVTLGNTRPVDTKSTMLSRNFARGVAGESGRPLLPYMLKLVEDVHRAFPDMMIIACGGIFSGEDAWKAYEKGATLLSLYTALTFYGFGVVRDIHDVLKRKLGSETLQGFIEKRDTACGKY
jgi:dihydroorotate dehydrogenase